MSRKGEGSPALPVEDSSGRPVHSKHNTVHSVFYDLRNTRRATQTYPSLLQHTGDCCISKTKWAVSHTHIYIYTKWNLSTQTCKAVLIKKLNKVWSFCVASSLNCFLPLLCPKNTLYNIWTLVEYFISRWALHASQWHLYPSRFAAL